jgi:hypothetical protein
MSCVRIVSLAFAVVIATTQWMTLSSALGHSQSDRAVATARVADHASDDALPVIVVRAQRQVFLLTKACGSPPPHRPACL